VVAAISKRIPRKTIVSVSTLLALMEIEKGSLYYLDALVILVIWRSTCVCVRMSCVYADAIFYCEIILC